MSASGRDSGAAAISVSALEKIAQSHSGTSSSVSVRFLLASEGHTLDKARGLLGGLGSRPCLLTLPL